MFSKIFLLSCLVFLCSCASSCSKYDLLVDKDEICNQMWSNYESQLQRRLDLIPNMINIVKGSAAHEEKVLKEVIEARASTSQIKLSGDDFSDPVKMEALQKSQTQLKGSLSRLSLVQESYPDLKANSQFHDLMVILEGTENRLQRAREQYNKAVMSFNTELRHVSGVVLNPLTGHDNDAKVAPKVDFSPARSN